MGGPEETIGPRLARWLKAEALALLDAESRALAAAHDISVTSVAVGDPRGRWGSCAADGRLRYSWRLIMMPPTRCAARRWRTKLPTACICTTVRSFMRW